MGVQFCFFLKKTNENLLNARVNLVEVVSIKRNGIRLEIGFLDSKFKNVITAVLIGVDEELVQKIEKAFT